MNYIYSTLLFALFLFSSATTKAQPGANAAALYEQASELMGDNRLEEAQQLFDRAFAIPNVEKDTIYPLLLNEQATLLTWRGERVKAINTKRAVIPMLKTARSTELDVSVYSDLGLLYNRASRIDSAIYFFELADSAAKALGDPGWQSSVKQNIGVMYYNLKRFDIAAKYLKQAADFGLQAGDDYGVVCGLQLLSNAQIELADTVEAGKNARAAWQRALASGNPSYKLKVYSGLVSLFRSNRPRRLRYHYMKIGYDLYSEMPQNSVISQGYVMAAARMHFNRGQWAEALKWYERQLRSPMYNDRATLYSQVAACYRHLGNFETACLYLDSARMVTDSMSVADATARLEEFNVKYGAMEREIENSELRVEALKRERIILFIVLLLTVLACGAIALFRHNRRIRRDMEELNRRRDLESAQNYIQGLEYERKYFAKELHDGIANDLLGLKMKVESDFSDKEGVSRIIDTTRDAVRSISHHLMPPQFETMTLPEVMRDYVAAISRDTGIKGTFTYKGDEQFEFPTRAARDVYRIAQEYLMNLMRHGDPTAFDVILDTDPDGSVELRIFDNSPLRCPTTITGKGIGQSTMNDRARSMNGKMSVSVDSDGKNAFLFQFSL